MKYYGEFQNWTDVQKEFGENYASPLTVPEPENLLFAYYVYEDYSGDAHVLWKKDNGHFGYVEGGHCSCYGLEGQWKEEELTKEQIEKMLESRSYYGFWKSMTEQVKAAIEGE